MIFFFLGIAALILGYVLYGKFVEKVFGITDEPTPAMTKADGVDYVPMSWRKATLIQFLNIAGTGPIFGAILGARWGYWSYLWIIFGCIFAGAVHDYFSGMLSAKHDGTSIAEVVGHYLGKHARTFMRVLSLVLLIFVGAVFIVTPAQVMQTLFAEGNQTFFYILLGVIILYYLLSTVLPIDKIIGRIYPLFGAAMIIMGLGIIIMLFVRGYMSNLPSYDTLFTNMDPAGRPIFPVLFITIACGAISGFHATQAPLMARCMRTQKEGRRIFYGSMIIEGIVAMIWATAAMAFFGNIEGLAGAGSAPVVVTEVSVGLMGVFGGALAVLGVVAAPITSGDTAFRSARLTIADAIKLDQVALPKRFLIAIPLFVIGTALAIWSALDAANFNMLWRYFAWSNQTLATIALWAATAYLIGKKGNYWVTYLPSIFMTALITTHFFFAPEFYIQAPLALSLGIGIATALVLAVITQIKIRKKASA